MTRSYLLFAAIIFWALMTPSTANTNQTDDILSKIEGMALLGENAEPSLGIAVAEGIEKNPTEISRKLLLKLKDKKLKENQLAVYVWALGLTKDPLAGNTIKELYQQNKSDLVRGNCLSALAMIGGKQSEEFLLSTFDTSPDKEMRFNILNLLGQMQCEAALPKTEEILKQDPKEFYWQPIFIFGKMGDKAVPFLLKKINDKNRNIRANAIDILGQWLIPPEAAKPLQDQFWKEKDVELRGTILSSLETTIPDLTQMKTVFEQVASKEGNKKLAGFARETLGNLGRMKADVATFEQKKQPSVTFFQSEYAELFKSAGKKGNYETLGVSSTAQDEPRLKALRERILQRNSDEAFYDYQKVNKIIILNRMTKKTTENKTNSP